MDNNPAISEALTWGASQLPESDSARLDAECLLSFALQHNRTYLYTWPEELLSDSDWQAFQALIHQRQTGHPIAHLTGYKEFWGLEFKVDASTLIPRPDTEVLIETALPLIAPRMRVLDLGTGTGAIACALKSECPNCLVTATDFQPQALKLAQDNAKILNLTIDFYLGSWFEALPKGMKFNCIVSNPPYIVEQDPHLTQGDVRFEPLSALTSGADGLTDLQIIIQQAPHFLSHGGWLLVEHGYHQAEAVQTRFQIAGFQQVRTVQDYGGNPRITLGQWP